MIYLNVCEAVLKLVNSVENINNVNGNDKKMLVLGEMHLLLGDSAYLQYKDLLEEIIEMIVALSKGNLSIDINKIVKHSMLCCCSQ